MTFLFWLCIHLEIPFDSGINKLHSSDQIVVIMRMINCLILSDESIVLELFSLHLIMLPIHANLPEMIQFRFIYFDFILLMKIICFEVN